MIGYNCIIDLLKHSGSDFIIHKHDAILTMEDVKHKLKLPLDSSIKTLIYKHKDNFIYVILKGVDKVDYKKLAAALDTKRSMIFQPTPDEIRSNLGIHIGGISPIPTIKNVKVIFDNNIINLETIFCGVGRNDRTLEIKRECLIKLTKGEIYPIAQRRQ